MPRRGRPPTDPEQLKPKKGETAYGFMQRRKRQEAKVKRRERPRSGITAQGNKYGFCDSKTRSGKKCKRPKGWGTNHFGIGHCKNHGGSSPNSVKAAANSYLNELMGREVHINPLDAILWLIRIKAGEVQWLSEKMAGLQEADWFEMNDVVGKQFNLYVRQRDQAMRDLAKFSNMAVSLGLAERAVRLAEHYADIIARLIKGIIDDLGLTDDQQLRAPAIVRRRLIEIESGHEVIEGAAKELPTPTEEAA